MKILFLDIETAPAEVFAWGLWKQNIHIDNIQKPGYTLCWAAKWHKKRGTMFSSLWEDGKEKMLSKIHQLLEQADVVVTYNGDKFDLPILNQEFLAQGVTPPEPYKTVDLLKTVRRNFRLASNKLDFVARHLGLTGKIKHKGMELWHGCMAANPPDCRTMQRYNMRDVTLLEQVYKKLLPWIPNHPNHGLWMKPGKPVCPNCGSRKLQKRGTKKTKTLKYQQYQCQGCGSWPRSRLTISTPEDKQHILVG